MKDKEYKQALDTIKKHEKKEDEEYRKKEIKHLKKFEGKYYQPRWVGRNVFEKVTKVDNKGNFVGEIIIIDIDISKQRSFYARDFGKCRINTKVGGTSASPNRNQITETHYNNVKKLIQEFEKNLKELKNEK